MTVALDVIGFLLIAGGFFGMGAFCCRWVDDRRRQRTEDGLLEGMIRKGGQNRWPSQVTERPPAPKPLIPAPPPRDGHYIYTLRKGAW